MAKKRKAARRRAPRANPPRGVPVREFTNTRGHLVSRRVRQVAYDHAQSATAASYRHDFESDGVELWALRDGSLLIRHPKHRLWADFIVGDDE